MPRQNVKPPLKKRSVRAPLSNKPPPVEVIGLRPEHAAQTLQISKRTLWQWVHDGRVEVIRPSRGITLVLMSSIKRLISASTAD
jgi:hypothetical protein